MGRRLMRSKDPDIIASEAALRRAAKRALQIGLETGTPVYVLINGKIVDLTKRQRRSAKKTRGLKAQP
jgi:hypothetical protein